MRIGQAMVKEQRGLTFLAPVLAGAERDLAACLEVIQAEQGKADPQERVMPFQQITTLHFARLVLLDAGDGRAAPKRRWPGMRRWARTRLGDVPVAAAPPDGEQRPRRLELLFVTSFDGSVDRHLRDLSHFLAHGLDRLFRHCEGYFRTNGSTADRVHAFLKEHDHGQGTFFVGAPGEDVQAIRRARAQHAALRRELRAAAAVAPPREVARAVARRGAEPPAPVEGRAARMLYYAKGFGGLAVGALVGVPLASLLILPVIEKEWREDVARRRADREGGLAARAVEQGRLAERTRQVERNELRLVTGSAGQRPLTHVVRVKPGLIRALGLRLALSYVAYRVAFIENEGTLGGIASIHFARWVPLRDGRLLFVSDYGGDWESYLGEFVDRASAGISGIWSNTEGFPATRLLTRGGSRDEWQFKQWVRSLQVETQVYYSAYPDLEVQHVRSNARLRDERPRMIGAPSDEEAAAWLARI